MIITFRDMDRWLTDNVIILTHMSVVDPRNDVRVSHVSRDMRPLACLINTDTITVNADTITVA